jgi:aldehyde decarbonylase
MTNTSSSPIHGASCDCRDDQIILNGLFFYVGYLLIPSARYLPAWRTDGAVATALLHAGPVEFLYYWFHRALHHHFLYSRYHSHHHSSIVTEPITCKCCIAYAFFMLSAV